MLVGRAGTLAELAELLGEPGAALVAVSGGAGSGKTALLAEFVTQSAGVGSSWSTGAEWESGRPNGIIEQLTGIVVNGSPDTVARQLETSRIVVVDDAHWADPESLQALVSVSRIAAEPVLVLFAYCPESTVPGPVRGILERVDRRIILQPLTVPDVIELARARGVELSPPTARVLLDHAGGVPRDIVAILRENPTEIWDEWQRTLPVPAALAASVADRLASCSPTGRALLEAGAVLGDRAPIAQIAELADVTDVAHALEDAHFAVALREVRGGVVAEFRRPLLRAAIANTIRPVRLHELHCRAAAIVDDEGRTLEHLAAARPVPDAALADRFDDYATDRAAVGAWGSVAEALIGASRLSVDREIREQRLIRAVDALVGAGRLPEAKEYGPELESFPRSPRRDAVLGYLAILLGRSAEATALLDDAWRRCDSVADPATAALVCLRKVLDSLSRWHGPDLVEWTERAVRLAEPGSPAVVESTAILGLGLGASGRVEEARAAYADSSTVRGAQTQRFQMGKGWLDLALDDPEAARYELETAVPTVFRMGSVRISLWAGAWLARTHFALGAWDEALATVERSARMLDDVGMELVRPLVHWTGAQISALRGARPAAADHLGHCTAGSHDYQIMYIPAALARAQCAEVDADYGAVIRALDPVTRLAPRAGVDEPGFWPWADVYANALVMNGRVDEADRFLAPHEERAAVRRHRSAAARLGYVRGRILGARSDIDGARKVFEAALDSIAALPLPYDRARVNFAYGQTLRRAGKRREADTVLNAARDAFAGLGATSYVQRCERELRAGGIDMKRNEDPFGDLTPQEQAVAALVARGASNREAAEELFLSVKTVQYHLTRVYAKLGVRSRSELARSVADMD